MSTSSIQAPAAVVMIRPHHFRVNPETAGDNVYQQDTVAMDQTKLARLAFQELTVAAKLLEEAGIRVHIFEDEGTDTPDSVFPNNWFSTHSGGHIALYPMFSEARRKERRPDVINMLKSSYRVQDVIDYSGLEPDGLFLEGTGAMVLDHIDRVAYAVKSNRTDPIALERFCTHFNYEPMVFEAEDENGVPVYHTNVLMCIATSFVMISLDMIKNLQRRNEIVKRFEASGRTVIDLSPSQIADFAGNAIELHGAEQNILALSSRALAALTTEQINIIEQSVNILGLDIPSIELAGGSVRCTLAGIHLTPR
ncbi:MULTISPECIES: citrulline utilization hydrolase CtlX [unclassified Cocleimonas]|uniref:citrulline utilization hydrolase CtlX n=1 Tax=unclassified Cocleimonas TaxID=2639732 RepID=UPI0026277C93|nr:MULTISPECIES: arginine deiminase-related protein [unclassified Cocleimonas]MEB8431187.1 arginine deiminase-related protein [Cocleimonas sp. KMM 6892]MEC4714041.1 arginine deiminase-related protein [Cocleimonas sp. KMM 6895]MEC4743372.1 arginine deiminase-related protein [Cocleimonas sp. KMM 6896]